MKKLLLLLLACLIPSCESMTPEERTAVTGLAVRVVEARILAGHGK